MQKARKPYIEYLKKEIETTRNYSLPSSSGFKTLSQEIADELGKNLSEATFKRLWGYAGDSTAPYLSTLDILAHFLDYKSFNDFCAKSDETQVFSSNFFEAETIMSSQLSGGDKVAIGWSPNRYIELLYLGGNEFEVVYCEHSKLAVGDRVTIASFVLGRALIFLSVLREGAEPTSYVAAENEGLTILKLIEK